MKFEINNIEWNIIECDSLDIRLQMNGEYCGGVTSFDNKEIYLLRDTKNSYKYKILLHELSHCVINDCLLSKPKNYTEEDLCEFVALYSRQIINIAEKYFKN